MFTTISNCPICGAPLFVPVVWHSVTPPPITRSCACVPGPTVRTSSSIEELMKQDSEKSNSPTWIAPKSIPDAYRDGLSRGDYTLYTIEEVSKVLKVSKATVRSFISEGRLEAVKINKRVYRISPESLEKFLREST